MQDFVCVYQCIFYVQQKVFTLPHNPQYIMSHSVIIHTTETRQPYSRKYWQSLNLAVWPQAAEIKLLAVLNLAVICTYCTYNMRAHINLIYVVCMYGSALFPFVRYLSRAIRYLLKQVLITVNLLSASCLDLQSLCTGCTTHECSSHNVGAWFIKH